MDVQSTWPDFPISLKNLTRLTTPIFRRFEKYLDKHGLNAEDFDQSFLKVIVTERVFSLVKKKKLSLTDMHEDSDLTIELFNNQEVLIFLEDGDVDFNEVVSMHYEYIDGNSESIGEFSFSKFYELVNYYPDDFMSLLSKLGLSISSIIDLYNQDYEMFCAFASDNAISFFQEYIDDIDIDEMASIYRNNEDLFDALINDKNSVVKDLGVREFIDSYKEKQRDMSMSTRNGPVSCAKNGPLILNFFSSFYTSIF